MFGQAPTCETVLSMPASKRYEYAVSESARRGEVWGLWGPEGWVWFRDREGRELYPLWPTRGSALEWDAGRQDGLVPKRMDLDYCLDRWVTAALNSGRMIAVFPVPGDPGMAVSPNRLFHDMKSEARYYEGWAA